MSSSDPGWDWFDGSDANRPGGPDFDTIDLDLAKTFARCFRDEDGSRVIAHLRAITIDRTLGPATSDAHLRHIEGQRQLVAYINTLIARGRGTG